MDSIIDTVSSPHPILLLIDLLKTNGKFIVVGVPIEAPEIPYILLIMGRKLIGGSGTRGMKETQEMVDFAANHNIIANVEVIPMDYVNTAMERLANGDVKYRFVIDIANTLNSSF
ncbi:probable mannitol dehydrogenase [Quercus suber]|uniref:probable mannitol dehydrogenase n=1 Tax=Quercus suber TaxID=58331 RepID=UPI0032DEDAE6